MRPVPVFVVWVDTRDVKGKVVQVPDTVSRSMGYALRRRDRINANVEEFPNMVAWVQYDFMVPGHQPFRLTGLTPENIREIRRRGADGETATCLAGEFRVSVSTASRIIRGVSWSTIE